MKMDQFLIYLNNFKIIAIPLLGIPLLVFCFGTVKFWIKRLGLKGKLSRFCQKHGFVLTWLRPPFLSMSTKDCKFDFTVDAKGKIYHVAILSARYRYREHCFASHDTLQINRVFQVKRTSTTSKYRKPKKRSIDLGVSTHAIPIELDVKVPADETKILLFYPVAKEVTCFRGGKKQYLESGEEIYHQFYLFSLSAFFKQLTGEKNYMEKKKIWQYD